MLRRFILVGVFVVVPGQGTVEQLAYGAFVALVFFAIQMLVSPFHTFSDNLLALTCSLLLTSFFIISIFYKFAALTDVDVLRGVMSPEQRGDYRPPLIALTAGLTGTSIGAIVIFAVIIFGQWVDDLRLRRIEDRAKIARRLRYTSNSREVMPPPVEKDRFHIFLSHTWAQVRRSDFSCFGAISILHLTEKSH